MKRFVKLAICLFFLLALSACSQGQGMENVRKTIGGDVSAIPGKNYAFIIRKHDGSIWYAFSAGLGDGVTSVCQLLPPTK